MTHVIEQNVIFASAPTSAANANSTAMTRNSKSAAVQKLLSRNKGATLSEIMAMTSWQPHSTRAFLTGLRKKGVELLRETRSGGETCWRIDR